MANRSPRILVVEDDEDDFLLLRDALKQYGGDVQVDWAENGEAALTRLSSGAELPHLILLDLNMPRKDGREALREIRADEALRHLPIVVLTNSSMQEDVVATYRYGGNTFIRKPANYAELVSLVSKILEYWFELAKLPG